MFWRVVCGCCSKCNCLLHLSISVQLLLNCYHVAALGRSHMFQDSRSWYDSGLVCTLWHEHLAEPLHHDKQSYHDGFPSDSSSVLTLTHLPAPSACTTNSLLMCYSWGWVWTLAMNVTVQHKKHTHMYVHHFTHTLLHASHDKLFKVHMNTKRLQTCIQRRARPEFLMMHPDWSSQRLSGSLVPPVDNFLPSTRTNIREYTCKQLL